MIAETTIGGLIGGFFRIVPELFKYFDRKNERKHELSMQDKALEFERLRGANRLEEIRETGNQLYDQAGLEALKEAIRGQSQLTGVWWIDAMNQLVRPTVTYAIVLLYIGVKIATAVLFYTLGATTQEVLNVLWTPADSALMAGILNFWFLDRVITKRTP